MAGETLSNKSFQQEQITDAEAQESSKETVDYENLGEQVPFDPVKAKANRLNFGDATENDQQTEETDEENIHADQTEAPESLSEPEAYDDAEKQPNPEQQNAEKTPEETKDKREKSRAERRLEDVEEKLNQIERELHNAFASREHLDEQIEACEAAIDDNVEKNNQLSDRAERIKVEIKRTKRNIINGFMDGLRLAKNLVLGRHNEARDLMNKIGNNVDANEKAQTEQSEVNEALLANNSERATLNEAYQTAIDARNVLDTRISRLQRQQYSAERQQEMLKEEVANEAWSEAWVNAQEGIKSEMGFNNLAEFKADLNRQAMALDAELESQLSELESYRNPSRVQSLMRTQEQIQQDIEKADQVERMLRDEHAAARRAIEAKRQKVEQYFPSWQERVHKLRGNNSIREALGALKRKAILRVQGAF